MPVPKFEDYRAPWETEGGEDKDIDKGKLKKYIHGLLTDKDAAQTKVAQVTEERDTLQGKVDEASRKDETETDRLKRENEELKAKVAKGPDGPTPGELRLEVALEKGLTAVQAKRLVGTTKAELEKDADDLLESFGGKGEGEGEGAARRTPRRRTNPSDPDPDDGDGDPIDIEKALADIPRIN